MNKEIVNLLIELDVFQLADENEKIYEDDLTYSDYNGTRKVITNNLSNDEIRILLMAKQTKFLKSIKNMIRFFVVVFIIGIFLTSFFVLKMYS